TEDGIRDHCVTGVQTCALPISALMRAACSLSLIHHPHRKPFRFAVIPMRIWMMLICEPGSQFLPRVALKALILLKQVADGYRTLLRNTSYLDTAGMRVMLFRARAFHLRQYGRVPGNACFDQCPISTKPSRS